MVNLLGTVAATLAALLPSSGQKEAVKPPLADGRALIIKVMPHRSTQADGNYVVEGEDRDTNDSTAQSRYDARKAALDERFARMFELKERLEKQQSEMSKQWEEYYALHEKYNKELQRIVAAWVTESHYDDETVVTPRVRDNRAAKPMPYRERHDGHEEKHVPHTQEYDTHVHRVPHIEK